VRDDFKPVAVGGNAVPSPSSSPLRKVRGERGGDKAKVTIAEGTSSPRRSRRTKKISCLPDSFGVRSHVRYCTVTSVPTGISEKNLRAVSSGNLMQPCDAG
jgi:hypothetical protein